MDATGAAPVTELCDISYRVAGNQVLSGPEFVDYVIDGLRKAGLQFPSFDSSPRYTYLKGFSRPRAKRGCCCRCGLRALTVEGSNPHVPASFPIESA